MQAIKRICIIARREIKFNRKNPRHVEEARKFSYFALGRANACKVIAFGVTKALLYTIILRNYFAVMRGNSKKTKIIFRMKKSADVAAEVFSVAYCDYQDVLLPDG